MLAFAGLLTTSCDESFSNWTEPEFNPQEEAITVPGLTATAQSAATINLAEAGDTVKLLSLSEAPLPQGAQLGHLRMVASPVGVDAEPHGVGRRSLSLYAVSCLIDILDQLVHAADNDHALGAV